MGTRDELARDADQIMAKIRAARGRIDMAHARADEPARPLRDELANVRSSITAGIMFAMLLELVIIGLLITVLVTR